MATNEMKSQPATQALFFHFFVLHHIFHSQTKGHLVEIKAHSSYKAARDWNKL